jgi:hypothetical protein
MFHCLLVVILNLPCSQYFFATSPKHPLMYLAVQQSMLRLFSLDDVGDQYVPVITGPGALKVAMIQFLGKSGSIDQQYHKPNIGLYTGHDNRTVTVSPGMVQRRWVRGRRKFDAWSAMNITFYDSLRAPTNVSCLETLYVKLREEESKH